MHVPRHHRKRRRGSTTAGGDALAQLSSCQSVGILAWWFVCFECHWLAQWIITFAATEGCTKLPLFPVFRATALPSPGKRGKEVFHGAFLVARNVTNHWASQWH
jgi:hypothetical protein